MKKITLVVSLMAVMVVLSSLANAQMSSNTWKANIPYSFQVESQTMPAGQYIVQSIGGRIRIASVDGQHSATLISFPKEGRVTQETSRLKFTNYGGQRFLCEMLFAGQEQTREFLKSRLEMELAKRGNATTEMLGVQ